jgi:hypothetical protein
MLELLSTISIFPEPPPLEASSFLLEHERVRDRVRDKNKRHKINRSIVSPDG